MKNIVNIIHIFYRNNRLFFSGLLLLFLLIPAQTGSQPCPSLYINKMLLCELKPVQPLILESLKIDFSSSPLMIAHNNIKKNHKKEVLVQKKTPPFHNIILAAANEHSVDPALIRAIIMAESGNNPKAVSKVGAKGLMQLMPRTAKSLGVKDPFNPEHNIYGGVKYFKKLLDRYDGNINLALAAYNAGSRKVLEYKGVPPFPATRIYIRKVIKYHRIYQKQYPTKGNVA